MSVFLGVSNNSVGTLQTPLGSGAGNVDIDLDTGEAASFADATFPFDVTIDNEIFRVNGPITGDTLEDCTRSVQGTSRVAHGGGSIVKLKVTAQLLTDVYDAINDVEADVASISSYIAGFDTDLLTFSVPAGTTISAFGASLVDDANAATAIATLGLDADLATFSLPGSTTISAFGATVVDDANAAAVISTLGLDADLATFSLPGSTTISAYGATLIDDAAASDARTTLGLGTIATQAEANYALLAGRSGGQTLVGGTQDADNLLLKATSGGTPTGLVQVFGPMALKTDAANWTLSGAGGYMDISTAFSMTAASAVFRLLDFRPTVTVTADPQATALAQVFRFAATINATGNRTMSPIVPFAAFGTIGAPDATQQAITGLAYRGLAVQPATAAIGHASTTVAITDITGLYFAPGNIRTGYTITELVAVRMFAPGGSGGSITNMVGLYVPDIHDTRVTGIEATVYSLGTKIYMRHAAGARFGSSSVPDTILHITGNADKVGAITFDEEANTPSNPSASAQARLYMKADKLVIQYLDGAQIRYKYLDLTGTGSAWTHTTSAP